MSRPVGGSRPPGGGRWSGRRGPRGSAAVLTVGLTGVLLTVSVLVAALGGVVADQRRVEAAADLAALAGAGAAQAGRDGCAAAQRTAARNGGRSGGARAAGGASPVRPARAGRPR